MYITDEFQTILIGLLKKLFDFSLHTSGMFIAECSLQINFSYPLLV